MVRERPSAGERGRASEMAAAGHGETGLDTALCMERGLMMKDVIFFGFLDASWFIGVI